MESEKNKLSFSIIDFTEYPGPRYMEQGEDSGERFYFTKLKGLFEEVLKKSSQTGKTFFLEINLDNTAGYASSFLDEAFGNLAFDFGEEVVKKHLKIVSNQEPDWVDIIFNETIPEWHKKKVNNIPRKPNLI